MSDDPVIGGRFAGEARTGPPHAGGCRANLELWGGVECTVNRVGARAFDQLERSGHDRRIDDLDRFANLGLRTLRYPVLWERVQPNGPDEFDWSWSDERLSRLRSLGIRPILGLLHHGSGPAWIDLLDPQFPTKFSGYARAVARRYSWIDAYVPINEPLTTARFSGLYGHWYPHRKDDRSFVRALLNQVEGIALAMREIRSVQPHAELVQTEDLGKTFSTEFLRYQADFENERRWITFDLLAGRVVPGHPLWEFIIDTGVNPRRLDELAARPCPPDVHGANYYVTSERYLDEDLEKYPPETHGGNSCHRYADVDAVRVREAGLTGVGGLLREMWTRYRAPMAVTEAHIGCTREEQVRWLVEIWKECRNLRSEQIDCRAVTAWALLGAFDWNSLVTAQQGEYEVGAFDVRSDPPRPTAVASVITALAQGRNFFSPVLHAPGWWHRPERIPVQLRRGGFTGAALRGPPLLVLGGQGSLGRAFGHICVSRGLRCHLLSRGDADVCDAASIRHAVEQHGPWAVINASGYSLIDEAETDVSPCFDVNSRGAVAGARVCAEAGLPYVTFSSDQVFDGLKERAYRESDGTSPLNVFGRSKEEAEKKINLFYPGALVIRSGAFFSPWNVANFAADVLRGDEDLVVPDSRVSPTYLPDLCQAVLDLLLDGETGIWHLANVGSVNWTTFAEMLAHRFAVPLRPLGVASAGELPARRPAQSVLTSERAAIMPSLESAIARFYDAVRGVPPKGVEAETPEAFESAGV